MMIRNATFLKSTSLLLIITFIISIIAPSAYALTSGPTQPEFSSFEPIGTNSMVDEFSGDFTYNIPLLEIPGPNGGSYPFSLSYHSGTTPEEEASWVGYGWTLNAGAISRQIRGIPDDSKGDIVTHHNKMPENWTATLGAGVFVELFSKDPGMFTPSLNATYRYNNYRGFSLIKGAGLVLGRGLLNLGYSSSEGESSFSLNISPLSIFNKPATGAENASEKTADQESKTGGIVKSYFKNRALNTISRLSSIGTGSQYSIFSYNQASVMPTQVTKYSGASINVSGTFQINPGPLEIGAGFNLMGSYSYQRMTPIVETPAFGFLYSSHASSKDLMDFHTEKDNAFDNQDEYIGIPFNDADQFSVTGEGIGGGFRFYTNDIGQFRPTQVESRTDIAQISPEFEAGLNFGGGVDIGLGRSTLKIADWSEQLTGAAFPNFESTQIDEPAFFRFNNDLGGSWGEKSKYDDRPLRMNIANGIPTLPAGVDLKINNAKRVNRSSYIGFHTNKQLWDDRNKKLFTYSKRNWNFFVDREKNSSKIGEVAITNEDGIKYIYALPVYSKSERNLNVGLPDKFSTGGLDFNFIAYQKNESLLKVGQEREAAYAHSYLLTEILTPDYIDRTRDGVTADDWGGYVKFGYHKIYGDLSQAGNWFRWRIPFNGVSYQRNLLSDKRDDMGTLVSGQKEIYYLKSVETKTHVGIFYLSDRADGMAATDDETAMTKGAKSSNRLKRLDKIELYSINSILAVEPLTHDSFGNVNPPSNQVKPIKTVHFKYATASDELMKGSPNNDVATRGKLTLTKVYFEYNGQVTGNGLAKISPYIFEYKYPTMTYPAGASNYNAFQQFNYEDVRQPSSQWNNPSNHCVTPIEDPENPNYSPFHVDSWGNFQPFGCKEYEQMRPWVNQKWKSNQDFDPAPWHLKRIILPSGGEIHVQYESDDYQYVQDQDAHLMIPLKRVGSTPTKMYLDTDAVGVTSTANLNLMRDRINKRYQNSGKKMYFKFLFTLKGTSIPNLGSCNSEYITGYAKVNAGVDAGGLFVNLVDTRTPQAVCMDFAYANVIGKVNETSNCDRSNDMLENPRSGTDGQRALAIVGAFFQATTSAFGNLGGTYCQEMSHPLSYLRVPTVDPKRGGGLRVLRLLMYDNSVEGPVLYGNRYTYTTTENGRTISSGVATNEPNREENILVEYLEKKRQNWTNKIVAGKDKEVSEGPLGETAYPGPAVGYSKVTITNIHTGQTNPGFSISEYYTAKDFPVKFDKTEIAGSQKLLFRLGIFSNKFINARSAVQGFSIVTNSMHGQLKRKASFSGKFTSAGAPEAGNSSLVSEQVMDYYLPGEGIPVMNQVYGPITYRSLGREVDISLAQRSISESSVDGNTEVDLTAGVFGIFVLPFFNFMGSMTQTESLLNTHATTKVVRYPAIVKRVTTYQDGIYHTDEYMAFNELNGRPIAVKSKDEFKGAYLNQSIPISWEYPAVGQKAQNEKLTSFDVSGSMNLHPPVNGRYKLTVAGATACDRMRHFSVGDLLDITSSGSGMKYFHVESIDNAANEIWLVKSSHSGSNSGPSSPSTVYQYTVIESGRNNQLNQEAGNIVFHDPIKENMDPSDLTDPNRYVSNAFTTALESAYETGAASFTMNSQYSNINMAAYASYAPSCQVNWQSATVQNLAFVRTNNSGSVTLRLTSFQILCSSGWITITR